MEVEVYQDGGGGVSEPSLWVRWSHSSSAGGKEADYSPEPPSLAVEALPLWLPPSEIQLKRRHGLEHFVPG